MVELLKILAEAQGEEKFVMWPLAEAKSLVVPGYVEINEQIIEDGKVATRVIDMGYKALQFAEEKEAKKKTSNESLFAESDKEFVETSNEFEIDNDVVMPSKTRRASKFPDLKVLEVGQSIHFPLDSTKKEDSPEKVQRRIASRMSAYNKANEGEGKYASRAVFENDPRGPGARIFRVK